MYFCHRHVKCLNRAIGTIQVNQERSHFFSFAIYSILSASSFLCSFVKLKSIKELNFSNLFTVTNLKSKNVSYVKPFRTCFPNNQNTIVINTQIGGRCVQTKKALLFNFVFILRTSTILLYLNAEKVNTFKSFIVFN